MAEGSAPTPKQDEHQPHPVKDLLPNIAFCITSPPPWREFSLLIASLVLLHCRRPYSLDFSITWEEGMKRAKVIQIMFFVAGLNTLAQSLFGTRLPAVVGGSFMFVPATISIILAGRYNSIVDPRDIVMQKVPLKLMNYWCIPL